MKRITEVLEELLVRDGLSAGPGATSRAHGMKDEGRSHMGAHPQVMADAAGGTPHRPTAGEEKAQPMRNSGKDRGNVTPAKFTGLHIVVDNCRNGRTQPQRVAPLGVRPFLELVSSR